MSDSAHTVAGVKLGVAAAGISYADRDDLLVMQLAEGAQCAAVFTRNAFCAAPVQLAKDHLNKGSPRLLLINSGNANAGTGQAGMEDAISCCRELADLAACEPHQVLPFSTGVIGERLPVERMKQAFPKALEALAEDGWESASRAIMTTDTRPKLASRRFQVDGVTVQVTGMAKGSGMIRPDMATMLAYLATDLAVSGELLQSCLDRAVKPSFNSITVDGDTSTNDACVLVATGASPLPPLRDAESPIYRQLADAVLDLCMELSRSIIADGEGATKLVDVEVNGAASESEARQVAYTIAHSPLVKTALFASDPNWGRILAAVGRAGIEDLVIDQLEIWLDDVCIVRQGGRASDYTEAAGQAVMQKSELTIRVELGRGSAMTKVVTCDLSYDYVKINAEYRT
ncbi:MAG: bifunctional glutamate N-acetyltransferase/amino-acid acetyltransferase ArgJ [Candidatus Thiodiazotropha lotti]|nr:bifunctional glutamate N-acetyltransferase/amino-acid acetyltransferase ArgJ [Candidatus Thiodiazotropha lotti]ODC00566.1 bifunctional ornithine acetyltransferase/N-acetylglutamate synthase [Candidatus Thiodiazotropha endoloripes]MCG7920238.1 bifunctional glutamate N-acetyltransferase/amino-acid acetyltransferase ArgJ [Candidatus Thiodiazotropha lotti]MCG8002582.1 bifunctional glutamate N-acetyltransferase/amino-acid acetyltransferase ArgJ [Candidatus Thiodiazotropha lotti]MCG8008431.1 bifun